MRILLTGCEKRLFYLCDAMMKGGVEVVSARDGAGISGDTQQEMQGYDWVIVDLESQGGREASQRFVDAEGGTHADKDDALLWQNEYSSCGVDVSKNGVLEFSCCLQQMARGVKKRGLASQAFQNGGLVFEYQSACSNKK